MISGNTLLNRDPETFHGDLLFTIAIVVIAEIHVYYKKMFFFKYREKSLEELTFSNDNI